MFTAARAPATRALARSFSTTQAKLDVSKLTLVGRLGAEPVERKTSTDKPYYTYAIATQAPAVRDADGNYTDGHTSWHNVFSFNENQHQQLKKLGKGSTVYVEADLEMRRSEQADGPAVDRVFLRQLSLRAINKVKPESEGGEAEGAESA